MAHNEIDLFRYISWRGYMLRQESKAMESMDSECDVVVD